jgi:cysteine desulfurase
VKNLYFDNAATTRPFDEVADFIYTTMLDGFGNASSLHGYGVNAASKINSAKEQIRLLAGGSFRQVVFTSGGTEANNLAISGSVPKGPRDTVVISSLEHSSVAEAAAQIAGRGGVRRVVHPLKGGVLNAADIAQMVDKKTALVSICHVAPELGTVQPVNLIARAVKRKNSRTRVHIDAVQAAGGLTRLDYAEEIDMISVSAHKFHGPQGVGALLLRDGVTIRPQLFGGDQQHGIRPGTLNLPGIAGMGLAASKTVEMKDSYIPELQKNVSLLRDLICHNGVRVLGDQEYRAPGMLVAAVADVRSEVLLHTMEKNGLYASSGSACHASRSQPSVCYLDEGLDKSEGVIRFSPGFEHTREDMQRAADIFIKAVNDLRKGRVS